MTKLCSILIIVFFLLPIQIYAQEMDNRVNATDPFSQPPQREMHPPGLKSAPKTIRVI